MPHGSPDSPTPDRPRATAIDRAQRVRFRRAVTLMLMTLIIPGSAQLVAGNRRVGRIAMRIWLVTVVVAAAAAVTALVWHGFVFRVGLSPTALEVVRLALMGLAIGWAALFFDAWRIGQPLTLHRQHRLAVVGVNGVLSLVVAGTLLFGAHVVNVQRDLVLAISGDGAVSGAEDGRFNIALFGGDAGAGRWGLRPDSITVASIDARTGRTVLISLPRNMQNFPFAEGSVMDEQFPRGFDCDDCYLNGVSTWAGDHPDLFTEGDNPGVEATVTAVEGITDLKINYWAMVNMEGFKDLVDAFGGVRLNVRQPIPVGGLGSDVTHYIQPGTRTLNGHDTLWFARARDDSDDYSRMARQKCVMNAMLQQVSPQSAVSNFQEIAAASGAMVTTSIPAGELGRFAELALKARSQKVSTLSLVPPLINTADPDMDVVHDKVAATLDRASGEGGEPTTTKRRRKNTGPVTGGSLGSLSEGYVANEAEDLGAAC